MTSLDEGFRKDLEPFSASYERRIAALKTMKDNNIPTYLSCEPILPVKEVNPVSIVKELKGIVDLFEFGMWNKYRTQGISEHYYQNYSDDFYLRVFREVIEFCEEHKVNYCLASHSKEFVERNGLPFKPHPLIKN